MKRPQPKEEKKEEKIKQIVIPEVLTIKELADKMKIVPSVIVEKTVPSRKSCNSESGNRL